MTILKKTQSSDTNEKNGFEFAAACIPILCADYIEYRLIYNLEPLTLAFPALYKAIEVVEKSLKVFISVNEQKEETLSWLKKDFGHNIEELRKKAAEFNSIFNDQDIKDYTTSLCEKQGHLYQYIRYGSHESIEGMEANPSKILPVIDKIFFSSLLLFPNGYKKVLNFSSPIKLLLTRSRFDQSKNHELLLDSLTKNNNYITEYEKYCITINTEQH